MTCVQQYNTPPPNRVVGIEAIQRGAFTLALLGPCKIYSTPTQLNPTIGRCAYFLHADPLNSTPCVNYQIEENEVCTAIQYSSSQSPRRSVKRSNGGSGRKKKGVGGMVPKY